MQNSYPNPLVFQRADPFIYKHIDGFYYFTASVPEYDRIEIRRSSTLAGLEKQNHLLPGIVIMMAK